MLKRFFKIIFKRLECSRGAIGVLSILTMIGIVGLYVGLNSVGEKSIELRKDPPAWQYADQQDTPDAVNLGELSEKQKAEFVKFMAEEAGPTAVDLYDDTGILTIVEKTGIFKIKDTSSDNDKILYETISGIQKEVDDMEQAYIDGGLGDIDDELDAIDDAELIDSIEESLKDEGNLEDTEVIELKGKLSRFEREKEYVKEKLDAYKYYEEKGYLVTDTTGRTELENRLEDLNKKISEASSQIEEIQSGSKQEEEAGESGQTDESSGEVKEEVTETTQESKTSPTIELVVTGGPKFSEQDQVCYYKVTAKVSGNPESCGTFIKICFLK